MKKLLSTLLVLGSTVAVAACGSSGNFGGELDTDRSAPYSEERTIGADDPAPVVRSAQPVFERRQVK